MLNLTDLGVTLTPTTSTPTPTRCDQLGHICDCAPSAYPSGLSESEIRAEAERRDQADREEWGEALRAVTEAFDGDPLLRDFLRSLVRRLCRGEDGLSATAALCADGDPAYLARLMPPSPVFSVEIAYRRPAEILHMLADTRRSLTPEKRDSVLLLVDEKPDYDDGCPGPAAVVVRREGDGWIWDVDPGTGLGLLAWSEKQAPRPFAVEADPINAIEEALGFREANAEAIRDHYSCGRDSDCCGSSQPIEW